MKSSINIFVLLNSTLKIGKFRWVHQARDSFHFFMSFCCIVFVSLGLVNIVLDFFIFCYFLLFSLFLLQLLYFLFIVSIPVLSSGVRCFITIYLINNYLSNLISLITPKYVNFKFSFLLFIGVLKCCIVYQTSYLFPDDGLELMKESQIWRQLVYIYHFQFFMFLFLFSTFK